MNEQGSMRPTANQHLDLSEEIHLSDYLSVLYRRRRIIMVAFCLVFGAVALYTFMMKPVYEVATTLHVRDEKMQGPGMLEGLGLTQQNPVETEIEILKSRTIAEEVVRRLRLDWQLDDQSEGLQLQLLEFASAAEVPEYTLLVTGSDSYQVFDDDQQLLGDATSGVRFQHAGLSLLVAELNGQIGDSVNLTQLSFNQVVMGLRKQIKASEVGKGTSIIRVAYQDIDPDRARDLINLLATIYLQRSINQKSEEARKSVDFIEQQLSSVRTLLDSAELGLEDFKRDSGIIRLDAEAEALIDQLTQVEKERSGVSLRTAQVNFALETLQQALAHGQSYSPAVLLDDPVVATLAQQIAKFEIEKRALLVEVTAAHPAIQTLNDQISQILHKLLAVYRSTQQSLAVRTSSLTTEMNRYEAGLKRLPSAEQQLARLMRLATVNADIYTFLLQKQQEARIAKAATISNISIIDPAISPDRPVKPKKKKNLLLGLIVGLMLGVGLAFFQEYLDDTITDVETAKRVLGFPSLAVIPRIPQADQQLKTGAAASQRPLITFTDPRSPAAEAFRSLRTSLHFSSAKKDHQVVLITSAFPGEGKSTISANLAETLSQTGARVLLIGCDLRRPTLHTIFDSSKTPGLTELLVGDVQTADVIQSTGIHKLDFISAGTTPPNPAELLDGTVMRDLILDLRQTYDTVILDAPPLLAVTDSSILTALCDEVIVVIHAGGVKVKAAQRVVELLESSQAPVVGFVMNDKEGKSAAYYSSYGYGYGYGYGEDLPEPKKSLWARIFKG